MKKYFVFFAVIVTVLSLFGLITNNDTLLPYVLIGVGILTLISGMSELRQKQERTLGIVSIFTSLITFSWGINLVLI
ncbi:hypothetical protein NC661_04050 [Aquibacillus koreensis]|uniref:DUF3953 domain-containing protein n=1 Tax=Aquibacillus koreensis TaxID=279446 RepID=A0A9X3WLG1_9BACI|nr:hypothetical protein [Aquibacillus koreensis]MCT2534855.1 hypothetical protein [Aquibacillus koreensis]MDC3419534.1 hypothetical protein [Aquibacillus koreensis]